MSVTERERALHLPEAARIKRPSWINQRTVLGLALFVTSLLGAQRVLASADERQAYWVAASDLPAGVPIDPADLELKLVDLPTDVAGGYIPGSAAAGDLVAPGPIAAGSLVPAAAAAATTTTDRAVTIPVDPVHALGGDLVAGQRVDVYATSGRPGAASTELILEGAAIVGVASAGGFAGEGGTIGVTVRVPADVVDDVVRAIRNGEIDIVAALGA